MFSTVSSYFSPQADSNPLDDAMRKGDFSQVDTLVKSGSNPAEVTSNGLTIIDHAIFASQIKDLPHLLTGAGSDEVAKPKVSAEILAYSKTPEAKALEDQLSKINPENLGDVDSEDYQVLMTTLETPIGLINSSGMGFQAIHLLAMFAKPAVLKAALIQHSSLVELKDVNGNTPLHYSAFNSDQGAFVELAKAGANIFAMNSKSESPLGNLVGLAQARDPLHWNKSDIFIFASQWLPAAVLAAKEFGYLPDEVMGLSMALYGLSGAAIISNFALLLEGCRNRPKKFLFTMAYLTTSWLPFVGLPIHAYNTYVLASRALGALKLAYNHAGRRPLKSLSIAVVKSSNAYSMMNSLYQHGSLTYYTGKLAAKVHSLYSRSEEFFSTMETKCGAMPESVLGGIFDAKVNPEFPKYVDCATSNFEEDFKETLEQEPALDSFYSQVVKPFVTEYASSCPQSDLEGGNGACVQALWEHYVSPYFNMDPNASPTDDCGDYQSPANMSSLSVAERIREIGSPKGCLAKATDIIGLKNICDKKFRRLYGVASLKVHPDQSKEVDKAELFTYLGAAKEMLDKERKTAC